MVKPMKQEVLREIASRWQTPSYVFDLDTFEGRVKAVRAAFGENVGLCYSMKANPFLLKRLPSDFQYLEVCSPGELSICERGGLPLSKVIFSGVNKTYAQIAHAMEVSVEIFTAESIQHMKLIAQCAREQKKQVKVLLRLSGGSQFGMDEADFCSLLKRREEFAGCRLVGIHYFTGTQKKKAAEIQKELSCLDMFLQRIRQETGFHVQWVEYGAGLAVEYFAADHAEKEQALLEEAAGYIRAFSEKYPLTVEMGRFFAADSGVYLTAVSDTKTVRGIRYAICDGGIHQLKYDGQTMAMQTPPVERLSCPEEAAVQKSFGGKTAPKEGLSFWCLCGSLCTTADVLVRRICLPDLRRGDVLAFYRTGAYSVTEGISLLLSRRLPRVLVYSETEGAVLVRDFFPADRLNSPWDA